MKYILKDGGFGMYVCYGTVTTPFTVPVVRIEVYIPRRDHTAVQYHVQDRCLIVRSTNIIGVHYDLLLTTRLWLRILQPAVVVTVTIATVVDCLSWCGNFNFVTQFRLRISFEKKRCYGETHRHTRIFVVNTG